MKDRSTECYCRHFIAQTEREIAETKKTLKQLQKRRKKYFDCLLKIEENGDKYIYIFNSEYENGFEMPEMVMIPSITLNHILKTNINNIKKEWFKEK